MDISVCALGRGVERFFLSKRWRNAGKEEVRAFIVMKMLCGNKRNL